MILVETGPRDPPILTPSVCLYILPLKEEAVFDKCLKLISLKIFL